MSSQKNVSNLLLRSIETSDLPHSIPFHFLGDIKLVEHDRVIIDKLAEISLWEKSGKYQFILRNKNLGRDDKQIMKEITIRDEKIARYKTSVTLTGKVYVKYLRFEHLYKCLSSHYYNDTISLDIFNTYMDTLLDITKDIAALDPNGKIKLCCTQCMAFAKFVFGQVDNTYRINGRILPKGSIVYNTGIIRMPQDGSDPKEQIRNLCTWAIQVDSERDLVNPVKNDTSDYNLFCQITSSYAVVFIMINQLGINILSNEVFQHIDTTLNKVVHDALELCKSEQHKKLSSVILLNESKHLLESLHRDYQPFETPKK